MFPPPGYHIFTNNNSTTGGVALHHAAMAVRAGEARCVLALGFERMAPGALAAHHHWPDRPNPVLPLLAAAARASPDADRAAKNHKHALDNNPYAQRRAGYSEAEVLASPQITNELTKLTCCPTTDGAACCAIASEAFVHANKLENQAIEQVATALATDYPEAFEGRSAMDSVGYGMTRRLADKVFTKAPASRDEVGVVELHDCFAANEVLAPNMSFHFLKITNRRKCFASL
ncbi:hypothetical protein F5148DRAFT_1282084 [Russula earlei]|uniref:Uncharacterized protein n=1 Tax=Russula earlei TaxID=71964 RepID=A0ACC0UFF4_9AGAM|nr:hypothetical protein F5148DRAFT_1282084 [Russula earlei]